MKLDNILLDFNSSDDVKYLQNTDTNIFNEINLSIVDYGFVTPFIDQSTKYHIPKSEVKEFRGNIVFSSLNQLNF